MYFFFSKMKKKKNIFMDVNIKKKYIGINIIPFISNLLRAVEYNINILKRIKSAMLCATQLNTIKVLTNLKSLGHIFKSIHMKIVVRYQQHRNLFEQNV